MQATTKGYVLIEVLLAMTVFAIAGSTIMMTLQNTVDASRGARDLSKAIYLTQAKLHEFKLEYFRRDRQGAVLGEFRGEYPYPGAEKFLWTAMVEYDTEKDAYDITVWTTWGEQENFNRRGRYRDLGGVNYRLRTFVPTARYNRSLLMGVPPTERVNADMQQRSRSGRGRRGGGRGRVGGRSIGGGRP